MSLCIHAFDHGREESFRSIAGRLFDLCAGLSKVAPELSRWTAKIEGQEISVASPRDAESVVAASARMWQSGDRELVAYGPHVRVHEAGSVVAELAFVAGIEPLGLPVWVPNRTELMLSGPLAAKLRGEREILQALLQTVATVSKPAWGFLSIDGSPNPPVPPFADGTPVVGWLTYLSAAYPAPPALPELSSVTNLGLGRLYVAHSSRPEPECIARLSASLAEAKVLQPAVRSGTEG